MENHSTGVVTRFPPSPTGFLHVGGARTALFNYLFAKKYGGQMVLRLEDTDKERSKPEYAEDIIRRMKWLGFSHDNKTIFKQSERIEVYRKHLRDMVEKGLAYVSKEKDVEQGDRAEVIRFKNPNTKIKFTDLIRGEIEFDTTDLGDFVIAKSLEEPLYHLAVVVDDLDMGITHVIRGEDHISNTPRQILLQQAIGAPRPIYAHLPLILAPDRSKLSKRKHGEGVSVKHYEKAGYLPEALVNFLALLGWNPGTDQEFFTLEELVQSFDLSKVQKGGAIFDVKKLDWINRHYIQKLSSEQKQEKLLEFCKGNATWEIILAKGLLPKLEPVLTDRIAKFGEIKEMLEKGELDYFVNDPVYQKESLLWKDEKDPVKTASHIEKAISEIGKIGESEFIAEIIKKSLWEYAEKEGRGNVLWPMRYALSGKDKSPDPFTLAGILGKQETLKRLTHAHTLLLQ
jgi:glutamyl-tRNA synthetase